MAMPIYSYINSRSVEYITNYSVQMNSFIIGITLYLFIGTISLVCDKEYFYNKVERIYEKEKRNNNIGNNGDNN
jgi:hypothetical protein